MKVLCCVPGCQSTLQSLRIWESEFCNQHQVKRSESLCLCKPPFTLHKFPTAKTNYEIRQRWVIFVNDLHRGSNNTDFTPDENSRVCSLHFKDGIPTPLNPCPTISEETTLNKDSIELRRRKFLATTGRYSIQDVLRAYNIESDELVRKYKSAQEHIIDELENIFKLNFVNPHSRSEQAKSNLIADRGKNQKNGSLQSAVSSTVRIFIEYCLEASCIEIQPTGDASTKLFCRECTAQFHSISELHAHFWKQQVCNNRLPCSLCSFTAVNKCSAKAHHRAHYMTAPHVCFECGTDFKDSSRFLSHMSQHGYSFVFHKLLCNACSTPITFDQFIPYVNHILFRHTNIASQLIPSHLSKYIDRTCFFCKKKVSNKRFISHLTQCRGATKHPPSSRNGMLCHICNVSFIQFDEFKNHLVKCSQKLNGSPLKINNSPSQNVNNKVQPIIHLPPTSSSALMRPLTEKKSPSSLMRPLTTVKINRNKSAGGLICRTCRIKCNSQEEFMEHKCFKSDHSDSDQVEDDVEVMQMMQEYYGTNSTKRSKFECRDCGEVFSYKLAFIKHPSECAKSVKSSDINIDIKSANAVTTSNSQC